ncbi:LOW QUALITY PROTEIN: hypothetical protein PHMEG_0008367 [Phytophthora megakarya]|uniref:Endonuclease/exonuclease/phosphatase domain-containing protein n=1 Tax=Phytophthora megakarya TaxID=4795 RepID=A0A225WIY2_9STRA|nr:LOW QUALITY PROTEIN: hypothetical protein PHMEG_0008367 [Phytophthora megakarya]
MPKRTYSSNFCETYRRFATNTDFQKQARQKTTWSQQRHDYCVYNQIDYILYPQNCGRFCLDAQSWDGASIASDHKIVTANFLLRGSTKLRCPVRPTQGRVMTLERSELIRNDNARANYVTVIRALLSDVAIPSDIPVPTMWNKILKTTQEAATQTIGTKPQGQTRTRKFDDATLNSPSRCLRLRIYNDKTANTSELRYERNLLLHQIRDRCRDNANLDLDEKISRIEATSVRDIYSISPQQLLLRAKTGKFILHRKHANRIVHEHFQYQFYSSSAAPIAPDRTAKALTNSVTPEEFKLALHKLTMVERQDRTIFPRNYSNTQLKISPLDYLRCFESVDKFIFAHQSGFCKKHSTADSRLMISTEQNCFKYYEYFFQKTTSDSSDFYCPTRLYHYASGDKRSMLSTATQNLQRFPAVLHMLVKIPGPAHKKTPGSLSGNWGHCLEVLSMSLTGKL